MNSRRSMPRVWSGPDCRAWSPYSDNLKIILILALQVMLAAT
jgi:hypothetical protein